MSVVLSSLRCVAHVCCCAAGRSEACVVDGVLSLRTSTAAAACAADISSRVLICSLYVLSIATAALTQPQLEVATLNPDPLFTETVLKDVKEVMAIEEIGSGARRRMGRHRNGLEDDDLLGVGGACAARARQGAPGSRSKFGVGCSDAHMHGAQVGSACAWPPAHQPPMCCLRPRPSARQGRRMSKSPHSPAVCFRPWCR